MVHTMEIIILILHSSYEYLHNHLPSLKKINDYVERSNYYSAKGITQIELIKYSYQTDKEPVQKYYMKLRYNPAVIMGESSVFVLDANKYSTSEIISCIQKRLYEINEFRYIQLHKQPLYMFHTNRADIAADITVTRPEIITWLCNMSFPYKYRRMERKPIKKDPNTLYFESCCFASKSREFNFYSKHKAMLNTGKKINPLEEERIKHTFRCEIQIKKRGIIYLAKKLPTKKSIHPFLDNNFCNDYLGQEIMKTFKNQPYVSRNKAVETIQQSPFKPYDKAVMLSIIDMIQQYKGLYELEKAINDETVHTPPQYGNLRYFREHWLKKIRLLGIQPIVIPDSFGIDEIPSIYELLEREVCKNG